MKTLVLTLCLLCATSMVTSAAADPSASSGPQERDIVHIAPNGVAMPLDRIILIRKGKDYCAVKFTKFWENPSGDRFALYEAYSFRGQMNESPLSFKLRKIELRYPKPQFSLFGHPFAFGTVDEIECGFCSLWWSGLGSVYFFESGQPQGDHGVELAPTKWTDVSQVNLFDPRLKWYRYDGTRKRVNVPVDDLW